MKTLILGDIHGLSIWKDIIAQEEDLEHIIFMGDYFDSFNIPGIDQLYNFNQIIKFKEDSKIPVTLLIGNHDHHYMSGVNETYSGYQAGLAWDIQYAVQGNMRHLQIAAKVDNLIFSHAGLSPIWLNEIFGTSYWNIEDVVEQLNDRYVSRPRDFNFAGGGFSAYGDSINQGPLWIRPNSLMKSNNLEEYSFKNDFIQIVGHTQQENIFQSFAASEKSMGSKYYIVDTLPSGGYVIYQDGKLTPKQLEV